MEPSIDGDALRIMYIVKFGILASLFALCCSGLGCGSEVDMYEPNDDLGTATPLVLGTALRASIGSAADNDIFQCDMSDSTGSAPFLVEVRSDRSEDLEVEVGISLPDAWEGISWPGWNVKTDSGVISLQGEATKGTLLIFISGARGVDYSVQVMRE
jgi:hypothetical protein